MGRWARAELVYGILIHLGEYDDDTYEFMPSAYAYDTDDCENLEDAENWDWKWGREQLGDILNVETFGHCDAYEEGYAVLTIKEVPTIDADCSSPGEIRSFNHPSEELIKKANQECERLGFPDRFGPDTGWVLGVSYG